MRALLGVLRTSDGEAELGPQPSVGDIPGLVATARDGGLDVSYVTTGTPRPLPIGAGLALYRIAQEGLTNILKHAGPAADRVSPTQVGGRRRHAHRQRRRARRGGAQ